MHVSSYSASKQSIFIENRYFLDIKMKIETYEPLPILRFFFAYFIQKWITWIHRLSPNENFSKIQKKITVRNAFDIQCFCFNSPRLLRFIESISYFWSFLNIQSNCLHLKWQSDLKFYCILANGIKLLETLSEISWHFVSVIVSDTQTLN